MAYIAVLLTIATLTWVPTQAAQATSDYDDLIHVTPELYVYTDGPAKSETMNISTTWWSDFKQTYAKRVAQNIGWPTDFVTTFEDIVSSGGSWGVIVEESSLGNDIHIVATEDPNATCGFDGPSTTGLFKCYTGNGYDVVAANYFTHSSFGGNGCVGSGGDRCSDNGMNIYSAPFVGRDFGGGVVWSAYNASLPQNKFFFMNFDVQYPTGYEGEEIPKKYTPEYVAMGDSYSSGEGNAPYEYGTDSQENACHRSAYAYPRLVQQYLNNGAAFVACSGAVSDYIANSFNLENLELPQIAPLSDDTKLVTLSIGGNDIGFPSTIKACLRSTDAQVCLDAIESSSDSIANPDFQEKLEDVFTEIKSLTNSETQIIVLGYPRIYPEYDDISGACTWGSPSLAVISDGQLSGRSITEGEVDALSAVHSELNSTIASAVGATNDDDIHFVDPTIAFDGHEICGVSGDWLHEVFLHANNSDIQVGSFHPNHDGQSALAELVKDKLEDIYN